MGVKADYLRDTVEHFDIKAFDATGIVESFSKMAFSARDLANASKIYDQMLRDQNCTVILCLAGSIFSAGLKRVVYDMVENNMVDAIVSTGALIADQDFFESLGFKHYLGTPNVDDEDLRKNHIDRIYDTFIDEDELRVCDETVMKIVDSLEPKPYSSREVIEKMGDYLLAGNLKVNDSIVAAARKHGVPIFVPAFSDCSAGFGFVMHQWNKPDKHASIDSAKDFLELTKLKLAAKETGLIMIGGGVPKNFTQDVVVAAECLGYEVPMHKYAIQITVADVRDGALSSSTLKEAHSWGKVDEGLAQMVYSEATLAVPILASYAYHRGAWKQRPRRNFNKILDEQTAVATV